MGSDTAWFNITFAEKDLKKFNEVLKHQMWGGAWWDEMEVNDGIVFAEVSEANYAWEHELDLLENAKLTFYGNYGAGSGFGAGTFASYKGDLLDVQTDHEHTPIINVKADLIIDQEQFDTIKEYYTIMKKVLAAMAEVGCGQVYAKRLKRVL